MSNNGDPVLGELVDQLAAMPPADREAVIAGLDETECTRLMPLLDQGAGAAPSPALTALIQRCRTGTAQSVTPRVAAMLAKVSPSREAGGIRLASPNAKVPGAWDRLSAFWRGRA